MKCFRFLSNKSFSISTTYDASLSLSLSLSNMVAAVTSTTRRTLLSAAAPHQLLEPSSRKRRWPMATALTSVCPRWLVASSPDNVTVPSHLLCNLVSSSPRMSRTLGRQTAIQSSTTMSGEWSIKITIGLFSGTISTSSQMTQCRIMLLFTTNHPALFIYKRLKLRDDFRCFHSKMCFRTFSTVPLNSPIIIIIVIIINIYLLCST